MLKEGSPISINNTPEGEVRERCLDLDDIFTFNEKDKRLLGKSAVEIMQQAPRGLASRFAQDVLNILNH